MFSLECMSDFYGENCSRNCGHCLDNKTCHHINGRCEQGCNPGYVAPFCNEGNHSHSLPCVTTYINATYFKDYSENRFNA